MKQTIIFYISVVIITIFVSLMIVNVVLKHSLEKEIQRLNLQQPVLSQQQKESGEILTEKEQLEKKQKECLDEFIKARESRFGKSKSDCLEKVDNFSETEFLDYWSQFVFNYQYDFEGSQLNKLVECYPKPLEVLGDNKFSPQTFGELFLNHLECKLINKNDNVTYEEVKLISREAQLKIASIIEKAREHVEGEDAKLTIEERIKQFEARFNNFNEGIDKIYQLSANIYGEQNSEMSLIKSQCEAKDFFGEAKNLVCEAATLNIRSMIAEKEHELD